MRFCITPRFGRGPDDDWYPWLARQLRRHEVVVSTLQPSPRAPTVAACVEQLRALLGTDKMALAQTVLIGHSVGCHANLRFLESLTCGSKVAGVLCVAGWWRLDEPSEALAQWTSASYNFQCIGKRAHRVVTVLGDNDPYTSDQQGNRRAWQDSLGASVMMVDGGGHLVRTREPAVLDAVRELAII